LSYWCDNVTIQINGAICVTIPIIGVNGLATLNIFELLVWQRQLFELLVWQCQIFESLVEQCQLLELLVWQCQIFELLV
jgi:hypothetical protein